MAVNVCIDGTPHEYEETIANAVVFSWNELNDIVPQSSVPVNRCAKCGEVTVAVEDREALEKSLHAAYTQKRIGDQRKLIDALTKEGFTQRQIEDLAFLSRGYLSKLRLNKLALPSTLRLLEILLMDPKATRRSIEQLESRIAKSTSLEVTTKHIASVDRAGVVDRRRTGTNSGKKGA